MRYLRSVDLPDPLGPMTPTSSPEASEDVTPCRMRVLAAPAVVAVASRVGLGLRGEKVMEEEEAPGCLGS